MMGTLAATPNRPHIFAGKTSLCPHCFGLPDDPQHFLPYDLQEAVDRIIAKTPERIPGLTRW